MTQSSCGNNHSWSFTGKQKVGPHEKYPNYYYKCSKCGKTGWAEQSGAPVKAY